MSSDMPSAHTLITHKSSQQILPRRFLFLLASGRREGNTELLAQRAANRLPADIEQEWLSLLDLALPPFQDLRHGDVPFPEPEGNELRLLEASLAATDIVFVTPLYWYSVPASAKLYLDYWSAWMRLPDVDFKARMAHKSAWAVCALSDDDVSVANPLIETLRLSAEYLQMQWKGVLLGYGSRPGDILKDEQALAKAECFFAA